MKKIIVLHGKSSVGKTTTIKDVYEAAIERYKNKCDIFVCALNKKFQNIGISWLCASDSIFKIEKLAKTNADNEKAKNEIINFID